MLLNALTTCCCLMALMPSVFWYERIFGKGRVDQKLTDYPLFSVGR